MIGTDPSVTRWQVRYVICFFLFSLLACRRTEANAVCIHDISCLLFSVFYFYLSHSLECLGCSLLQGDARSQLVLFRVLYKSC